MNPTLWALGAAFLAVGAEYLYRTLQAPWAYYLWLWVPIQLGIGFCIYKLVTVPGTPLVGALIVWSFAIIALRVFTSMILLHDRISSGTWAALALLILARVAQTIWP